MQKSTLPLLQRYSSISPLYVAFSSSVCVSCRHWSHFPLIPSCSWRKHLTGLGAFRIRTLHNRRNRVRENKLRHYRIVAGAAKDHNFVTIAITVAAIYMSLSFLVVYVRKKYFSETSSVPSEDSQDRIAGSGSNPGIKFSSSVNDDGVPTAGDTVEISQPHVSKAVRNDDVKDGLKTDNVMTQYVKCDNSIADDGTVSTVASDRTKQDQEQEQTTGLAKSELLGLGVLVVNTKSTYSEEAQDTRAANQIMAANKTLESGDTLINKSLEKKYQDIRMEHQIDLANEEHLSGLQGSVVNEKSTDLKQETQETGAGRSIVIADKMRGAGLENPFMNRKMAYLEEAQDMQAGYLLSTNENLHETGIEGLSLNAKNACSEEVHDAGERHLTVITNEVQELFSASYSKSDNLEVLFSSNQKPQETEPFDGTCVDHLNNVKMETDYQHRWHLGNHEGSLPIANADQELGTSQLIEERVLLFAKEESRNAMMLGNQAAANGVTSVASVKKKRFRHKFQGHSVGFNIKLKDLLPIDATKDSSEYLRYYDRWLRVGRFEDCIELLESMENVGVLDMNKVYHTRFFEICKTNRAVKEAFRFVKLIGNPTLSTFNMLLSVCASAEDVEGAFQVLPLVKKVGLKADCKLYTALISSCAKGRKVDIMFKVFHEMVNAGIEPSIHTYGALIDGCARAGQVAKAFGVYGIMRSKKVKPDRVIFNALITACGRSGAVDRAFDVLSEMRAEPHPLDPDHVTVGALINACSQSGQIDRALEVYKMVQEYGIKGTADVYTMAVNACSHKGDLDSALGVYNDMMRNGVRPDEVFYSALIDAAGHAGKIDDAFEFLHGAKLEGLTPGSVLYSSLMGACSNTKCWQKALEVYEEIKVARFIPTVSTLNALITSLCDADKLHSSVEVLEEMKQRGVVPNCITYTILLIACERKDEPELAVKLFSRATMDGVVPNLTMCNCVIGLCLRRFQKASALGESIVSNDSGNAQIHNQWTSRALLVYRQTISAGVTPTIGTLSQVLGCLRMPTNVTKENGFNESLGLNHGSPKRPKLYSLLEGFGIYDPRAFSLYEEAASLGVVPCFSYKNTPVSIDARQMEVYVVEVYLLTILKGLKYRLAAGARLPNITVRLPVEKMPVNSINGQKLVNVSGRTGQAVAALFRRLNLPYQGNETYGKIRISGGVMRHWLSPKSYPPSSKFPGMTLDSSCPNSHLGKGIVDQQRMIRTEDLSIDESTGSLIAKNLDHKGPINRPWED